MTTSKTRKYNTSGLKKGMSSGRAAQSNRNETLDDDNFAYQEKLNYFDETEIYAHIIRDLAQAIANQERFVRIDECTVYAEKNDKNLSLFPVQVQGVINTIQKSVYNMYNTGRIDDEIYTSMSTMLSKITANHLS